MLNNATILLIRHGEKDNPCEKDSGKDKGLNALGKQRAQAYVEYFASYTAKNTNGGGDSGPLKLTHLFAAADSNNSHRPRETLEPLAAANPGVPFDCKTYSNSEYKTLVDDLTGAHSDYDQAHILICWHHGEIVKLANDLLGKTPPTLPPEADWPKPDRHWPCQEFGWVMQIRYDGNGAPESEWVRVVNEELMPDDKEDPPEKWPKKP